MKKIILGSNECRINKKIVEGQGSSIFLLEDGSILKCFNHMFLKMFKDMGIDIEKKIIDAKHIEEVPEIIVPIAAVYNNLNGFTGYKMQIADGVNLNEYDDLLSLSDRADLYKYADMHNKLEDIIRRGNKNDVVFPDFCTCDNIYINKSGKISLIDYDGLQVGKHKVVGMSTSLGDDSQYFKDKYISDGLFTSELDKKSLLILYFLDTFNIDLNKIGLRNPSTGERITLDDVFDTINLTDLDFMHKIANILNPKTKSEFIGEDTIRIADKHYLDLYSHPFLQKQYLKRLRKK